MKKIVFFLALSFGLLLVFIGSNNETNNTQSEIQSCDNANFNVFHSHKPVILTANSSETNAVLAASGMNINLKDLVENHPENLCFANNSVVINAKYDDINYLIVKGPMGTDSEEAAELLFSQVEPSVAIFSGIAGGTAPDSVKNTTYIPGSWVERETGNTAEVSSELIIIANSMGYDTTITGATATQYVCDGNVLYQQYNTPVVDMESYGYATAAAAYGKHFIAIRSISDLADCTQTDEERLANNATAAAQSAPVALQIMQEFTKENK